MSKTTKVTAENGTEFTVRLMEKGDYYGRENCLTHDQIEPQIEFYDTAHPFCYDFVGSKDRAEAAGAERWGQFVSRYTLSTILADLATTRGLCLQGGVLAWSIDGDALRTAIASLGIREDKKRVDVGDVVSVRDMRSPHNNLWGIVMGEEVWLDDNTRQTWNGTGNKPTFVKKSGLDHPPERRLTLHLLCPDKMYEWRMEKFLEQRKQPGFGGDCPFVFERELLLVASPKVATMDDTVWCAVTRFPASVTVLGNTEAHARHAVALTLQSHFPYSTPTDDVR